MLDMQAWYVKNKMNAVTLPPERLVNTSYVQEAAVKPGPVVLENKDRPLPGRR